jgi:LuxR family maltose regulon positive regulatory protein
VRVFVDERRPALDALLRDARPSDAGRRLAHRVLAADWPPAAPPTPAAAAAAAGPGLVDPLSDRELDVLRLLRGELNGPEIARELHVSLNTFRTHTKNIYAKLGVTSRRGAVRRATELGL